MIDKALLKIRKSKIGNWYFSLSRNRMLEPTSSKSKKGKKTKNIIQRFLGIIKKAYMLVFLASLIVSFLIFNFFTYFQIKPMSVFENEKEQGRLLVDGKEMNILILGVEHKNEYTYLNLIQILTLDFENGKFNLYSISPYSSYSGSSSLSEPNFQFKSLLNNLTLSNTARIEEVMNTAEDISGIRIDRYIAFDVNDFSQIAFDEASYDISQVLKNSEELKSYFFDTQDITPQELNKRQLYLIHSYFVQNASKLDVYFKFFLKHDKYTEIFRTNMSRGEIKKLLLNLSSITKTISHYDLLTMPVEEKIQNISYALPLNQSDIDNIVQKAETKVSIRTEQPELEIYNSTNISGLATKMKRELQNIGVNVVKYGNYFEEEKENILYVTKDIDLYRSTVDEIRRMLRGNLTINTEGYKYNHTGDLILVLGKKE